MAICRKCGHQNDDNSKFCGACGARIDVKRSDSDLPPQYDNPKPKQEEPKPRYEEPKARSAGYQPRTMSSKQQGTSSNAGKMSKSCGCLILMVILLIGGIIAYIMFEDSAADTKKMLGQIETPDSVIKVGHIKSVSSVSTSEEEDESFDPSIEPGGVDLPVDKEFINKENGIKIGFSESISKDGKPVYYLHYIQDGAQGREIREIYPIKKGRYSIFNRDGETIDGEVYVYPSYKKILITSKGENVIYKTADSFSESVSSTDPSYTPARYAIKAGSDKGKWQTLQSGETVYIYPSGIYARSVWIKDGSKYYYVDASGCRMKNNYAHDGFYAGKDGSWDNSVSCIDVNKLPGKEYTDRDTQRWTFNVKAQSDGTISGTAQHIYRGDINLTENYVVKSFGHSAYSLVKKDDDFVRCHVVVLDNGHTILVSSAGSTEKFLLN